MSHPIPCNLITGFLGVGKTTAILHLLEKKPENETWAVLVNEFGEIGIDGAMMQGKGAVIREVPGGCMCCVAGLPMQIGLNMLIARSKPDRILIEPTGLGHAAQILDILQGEFYQDVLDLKATLCLVDPRQLAEPRYLENDNFRDQIAMADVLVANKVDQCTEEQLQAFDDFGNNQQPAKALVTQVSQGKLNNNWLNLAAITRAAVKPDAHKHQKAMPDIGPLELPPGEEYLRRENKGQAHFSCGWLFAETTTFSFNKLFLLFNSLDIKRLKAVVKTDMGVRGFNMQEGVLSVMELDEAADSRIEIIDQAEHSPKQQWHEIENLLLSCRLTADAEE